MIESMESNSACGDRVYPLLYPLNKSLAEEVERLFSKWSFSHETAYYETSEGKHIYGRYTAFNRLEALLIFQSVPAGG
jgi:hypothetical protein